jgi:type IX secretion system PorP/SprF family membrane protein
MNIRSRNRVSTFGRGVMLVLLLLSTDLVFSQDIHFSQFQHAPFNLNPASAGQFNGDYRFIGNQRTQWRSVTVPYVTFGGSVDARGVAGQENLAGAFSLYHDKAGDSQFSTLQSNIALAYLFSLSEDSLHFLSGGVQIGLTQRSIDYSALNFDSQYSGYSFNPNLPHGETFGRDRYSNFNLNVGASYFYQPEERKVIQFGFSAFNLTAPDQSFFLQPNVDLSRRYHFHTSGVFKMNEEIDLLPAVLFMYQRPHREIILGSSARYIIEKTEYSYRTIHAGIFYRNRDAGYAMIGMDYDNLFVGVSYDLNVSQLKVASNGRGALEFSLIYIVRKYKPKQLIHKACPTFL